MGDDDFLQNHKQYFSLADMEFMLNHFQDHSASSLMGFPGHDNFGAAFPSGLMFVQDNIPAMDDQIRDRPKRKQLATDHVSSSTTTSSPQLSHNGISTRLIKRGAGGARAKKVKKEEEKEREVIHVRAKRGEATDSHSLAERVRRGKINERLRCLQDIVPGCYKTMGMAVMLDEIINYVQSLQNQVEFLSMRLTAASTFHDFNSDTDNMDAMHAQRAKAFEVVKGQQEAAVQFPHNFGYCPDQQLPRTR